MRSPSESQSSRRGASRSADRSIATAADLAARLGVSRSTVSIVLRGDATRRKISPDTVRRVLDAARRYNYVPNALAQNLRRRRSGVLAVLVSNFRMDWCEELMAGMDEVLDGGPVATFVAAHRNAPARQERELLASLRRRDDAVIVQPIPGQEAIYRRVRDAGVPLVFLGDYPSAFPQANYVVWDSPAAAGTAVRHLIDVGRRRIGYVGNDLPLTMHLGRYAAFERVLRAARLPVRDDWVVRAAPDASLDEILGPPLRRLFGGGRAAADRPDALFMMNDGLAVPALEVLERLGVHVPRDVAVVGMGDLPLTGHLGIGLSTVREPVRELGAEAARAATSLIRDPAVRVRRVIRHDQLIARRTTACP